jgi:hypothetical protein
MSVLAGLIAVMVLFMIVTISTRVISAEAVAVPPDRKAPGGEPPPGVTVPDGIDATSYAMLELQIAELEKQLVKRQDEREDVRRELEALKAVVRKMELEKDRATTEPRKGVRLGEPTKVRLIPAKVPGAADKKPVFIEVDSEGYVVHPGKKRFPPITMKKGGTAIEDLVIAPELSKFLEEVARDADSRYPLLLIHPSGAETFRLLGGYVLWLQDTRYKNLSVGWEPFSSEWMLYLDEK